MQIKIKLISIYIFFTSSIILCQQTNSDSLEKLGYYYLDYSEQFVHSNYDSTIYFTEKASKYFLEAKNFEYYIYTLTGLANMDFKFGNYNRFIQKNESVFIEAKKYLPDDHEVYLTLNNNQAPYFLLNGDSEGYINLSRKTLELANEIGKDVELISILHFNLGLFYYNQSDFIKSYNELSLSKTLKESIDKNDNTIGFVNLHLAHCCTKMERFDEANKLLNQCIYDFRIRDNKDYLFKALITKLKLKNTFDNIQELEFHLNEIVPISALDSIIKNRIKLLHLSKLVEKDRLLLDQTIEVVKGIISRIQNKNIAQKETIELLKLQLRISSESDIKISNEKLNKMFYSILNNRIEKDPLSIIEVICFKIIHDIKQNSKFKSSDFDLLIKNIDSLSKKLISQASKNVISSKLVEVQETILNNIYFENNIGLQLKFFEVNKAISLLDNIQKKTLKKTKSLNADIFIQEQKSKSYINFLHESLSKIEGENTFENLQLKKSLSNEVYKLDSLVNAIKEKHPNYYNYKYKKEPYTIENIKEAIAKNEILIEYFVGEFSMFAIIISQDAYKMIKIDKAKCDQLTSKFIIELKSKFNYQKSCAELSKLLIEPISNFINNKFKLIIVPDGFLVNLPFEILEHNNKKLVENFDINYQYSYKMYDILREGNYSSDKNHTPFLGVSYPSFTNTESGTRGCLDNEPQLLACSNQEIDNIQNILELSNVNSELTTEEFIAEAQKTNIIHISTHACPDDEDPEMSRIYFKDDYLTNYDLSAMQMNANLAVLSACETGVGQFAKGEGAMSISKAFFQAGVPSTVVSLWQVDDCSTSELMGYFYEHLNQGEEIDRSLRMAKLDFLKEAHPKYHHPFYWAGFIHIGLEDNPMVQEGNELNWLVFLGITCVFGITLFLWFRRKMKVGTITS